jgi:hypothetical protein
VRWWAAGGCGDYTALARGAFWMRGTWACGIGSGRESCYGQQELLLAPDGNGTHTHTHTGAGWLAGLGRMGVGVCCIQAEYHALKALPGALLSTIQGYSALTCPAALHFKTAKTGELSTEARSRRTLSPVLLLLDTRHGSGLQQPRSRVRPHCDCTPG